jgi:hypothetical protein
MATLVAVELVTGTKWWILVADYQAFVKTVDEALSKRKGLLPLLLAPGNQGEINVAADHIVSLLNLGTWGPKS